MKNKALQGEILKYLINHGCSATYMRKTNRIVGCTKNGTPLMIDLEKFDKEVKKSFENKGGIYIFANNIGELKKIL